MVEVSAEYHSISMKIQAREDNNEIKLSAWNGNTDFVWREAFI